ncbi:hypothetical protein RCC89_17200 [Cytophagaceae bacterium ABcell3]|nr:hypothetical protein RCC89_17200 [Cytophagaceae bacterium ABcell3]
MRQLYTFYLFVILAITMSGCEIIADIFAAGVWVGVIGILIIVGIIVFIISKVK